MKLFSIFIAVAVVGYFAASDAVLDAVFDSAGMALGVLLGAAFLLVFFFIVFGSRTPKSKIYK